METYENAFIREYGNFILKNELSRVLAAYAYYIKNKRKECEMILKG